MKLIEVVIGVAIIWVLLVYAIDTITISRENFEEFKEQTSEQSRITSLYNYSSFLVDNTSSEEEWYIIFDDWSISTGDNFTWDMAYRYECKKNSIKMLETQQEKEKDAIFCEIQTQEDNIYNYNILD